MGSEINSILNIDAVVKRKFIVLRKASFASNDGFNCCQVPNNSNDVANRLRNAVLVSNAANNMFRLF